ncbi:hypothetical protein SLS56_001590 [Neofusicoccum ribis]|uniref:C2H2 finger domain protein n=1 Tax=Neofusicoccum ribis TaxID=45134 RepID=A0ABR3T7K0_9PEZI
MDNFGAFDDLPQIQLHAEGHLQGPYRWSDREAPWIGARPNQRGYNLFGSEVALDTAPAAAMSSMQRYLSGPERLLFETNVFSSDREPRRFDFDPRFEPQAPWPYPEKHPRQRSPDNCRSSLSVSSGSSSYNFSQQDDLSTNSFSSPDAGSSPREYGSHDITYDYKPFPAYSMEDATVGAGGSCTLQDIQQYPSPCEDTEPPMEYDDCPDMKMGYACEQETILFHGKMEADDHHHCAHLQEDDVIRVRDAESVKPVVKHEEDADSDYSPQTAKRRRRRTSQSSNSSKGSSRRSSNPRKAPYASERGRISKRTKSGSSPKDSNPVNRPFPCPFAGYSCQATFASKNEWKRHVSTQHIRLGFWRCSLCPSSLDDGATISFNDFNRKDLFAQHLRRMHMTPSSSAGTKGARSLSATKDAPVTEENMADFQKKCYQKLRDPPPHSSCLFCTRAFDGPGSWFERLEHVGRHFEKDRKPGAGVDTKVYGIERWREDRALERWLCKEGLIEQDGRGEWQLGDGAPKKVVVDHDEIVVRVSEDDVDGDSSSDDD